MKFQLAILVLAMLVASALADGPAGSGLQFHEITEAPQGIRISLAIKSTIPANILAVSDLVFAGNPAAGCGAGADPSDVARSAITFGMTKLTYDKLNARLFVFADISVPLNTQFLLCYDRAGTGAVPLTSGVITVKTPSLSLDNAPVYQPVWYNPVVSMSGNYFWSYIYDNTEQPTYFLRAGSVSDPNVCNSSVNPTNASAYGSGYSDGGVAKAFVGWGQQGALVLCVKPAVFSPGLVIPRVPINFVTVSGYSQSVSSFIVNWDNSGVFTSTPSKIIISYTLTGADNITRKQSHTLSGSNITSLVEYVDPSPLTTSIGNLCVRFYSSDGTVRSVTIGNLTMSKLTAISALSVSTSTNPDATTFVISYPTNYSLATADSLALLWNISITVAPGTVLTATNIANPAANQLTYQNNIATIVIPNSAWTGGSFPADLSANPLTSATVGYTLYGGVAPTFTKSLP